MATQKDIAQHLGVSASLVSKVLNDRLGTTNVRPELVEAIRNAADELGYRPNLTAKALAQGRQGVIGVFLRRIGQPGSGINEALAEGILAQARISNQKLLMNFYSEPEEFRLLCSLADRGIVDGLIIGGFIRETILPDLLAVNAAGTPVITACHEAVHPTLPNVTTDQVQVGRLATLHLIERGCRRIAHLNTKSNRFAGYKAAMAEHDLPLDDALIWPAVYDLTYEAGTQAVAHWLAEGLELDGIVAQSDEQAAGALNALIERGRRVPEDVRIIGIDNAPYCNYSIVPLSSVSQSFETVGRTAVDLLMTAVGNPEKAIECVDVQPVLHARRSTR